MPYASPSLGLSIVLHFQFTPTHSFFLGGGIELLIKPTTLQGEKNGEHTSMIPCT